MNNIDKFKNSYLKGLKCKKIINLLKVELEKNSCVGYTEEREEVISIIEKNVNYVLEIFSKDKAEIFGMHGEFDDCIIKTSDMPNLKKMKDRDSNQAMLKVVALLITENLATINTNIAIEYKSDSYNLKYKDKSLI